MFSFFAENDLMLPKKSGFRPGDACTSQLLSTAHEILSEFDDGHEVRDFFSIHLKRLIEFGMKGRFSSYNKTGYQES